MNIRFIAQQAFRTQFLLLWVVFILPACNTVPKNLRSAPEVSSSISDVQASPGSYQNEIVRWGGSIVDVKHANGKTLVQVVSRPLSANSRPAGKDQTDGRFLAVFKGFLEPEIYTEKRLLTVLGFLDGLDTQKIGELDYALPVVKVQEHHLWKIETTPTYPYRRGDPWGFWNSPYPYYYYDGFYSPFWHRPPRPYRH